MTDDNIVKRTCKELGLTYKELGERIGYSEGALKTAVSTGKVSEPMRKAIALLVESEACKNRLEEYDKLFSLLRKFMGADGQNLRICLR